MRTVGSRSPTALRGSPLRGRVAVATGAARGVGEALVRRLAAEAMRIALLGREKETLSQVAASLAIMTVCIEADVTDQTALDRAARQVEERLGAAGVVVANAGIAVGGPFSRTDAELWRRVVDVNLVGAANTARGLPSSTHLRGRPHHPARTTGGIDRRARCRCRSPRGGWPCRGDVGQARDLNCNGAGRRPEGARQTSHEAR